MPDRAKVAWGRARPETTMSLAQPGGPARRSPIHRVLNHVSIRTKLATLAAISVLLMLALAGWLSWQNQANELRGREQALQQNAGPMACRAPRC